MNEMIFLFYILVLSSAALFALSQGKEALIAFICLITVLMNLFVLKQIRLFSFTATASDALAVSATLSLNLLQEYYNKQTALWAIWLSFCGAIFYTLISLLHLSYAPAVTDCSQEAFIALLNPMPRIIIASLASYLIAQYIDTYLYSYFKKYTQGRYFILRNYGSLAISQLFDTVLFAIIGLYKLNESFNSIFTIVDIILVSYSIKLIAIGIAVPYVRLARTLKVFQPS